MESLSKTYLETRPHSEFAEVIRCIGHDLADKIIAEFGGREFFIPAPHDGRMKRTVLYKLIGKDATRKLIKEFGTGRLEVPIGEDSSYSKSVEERRRVIRDMIFAGASRDEIARTVKCTRQTVLNHRRRLRERGELPEHIPSKAEESSAA